MSVELELSWQEKQKRRARGKLTQKETSQPAWPRSPGSSPARCARAGPCSAPCSPCHRKSTAWRGLQLWPPASATETGMTTLSPELAPSLPPTAPSQCNCGKSKAIPAVPAPGHTQHSSAATHTCWKPGKPTGKLATTLNIPPARAAEESASCGVLWVWVHLHV